MKNKLIVTGTFIIFIGFILATLLEDQQFELKPPKYHYFLVKEYQVNSFTIKNISDAFKEIDDLKISMGAIGFFRVIEQNENKTVFQAGFQASKYTKTSNPEFKLIELNDQNVAINNIHGSYSKIKNGYVELNQWVEENHLVPDGIPYELYLNSPMEVSQDKLRTQILLPVIKND